LRKSLKEKLEKEIQKRIIVLAYLSEKSEKEKRGVNENSKRHKK